MEATKAPSATVFVGNVPYGVTEEQLADVFGQCGPVKSFRIVTDRDTGKPKGYGFCNFYDIPTAQSAQRNLNGYEVNGRILRVDFAEETSKSDRPSGRDHHAASGPRAVEESRNQPVGLVAAATAAQAVAASPVSDSTPTPPGAQDAISLLLAQKARPELHTILAQMQGLLQQNPGQARQILVQNPQLARALLQAQILLGMVRLPKAGQGQGQGQPGAAQGHAQQQFPGRPQAAFLPHSQAAPTDPGSALAPASLAPPAEGLPAGQLHGQLGPAWGQPQQLPAPPQALPLAQQPQQQHSLPGDPRRNPAQLDPRLAASSAPQVAQAGMSGGLPGAPPLGAAGHGLAAHLAPGQGAGPAAAAPGRPQEGLAQQAAPAALPGAAPVDQHQLLDQVMKLTPAQIDQLSPEQKHTILALQAHVRQQRMAGGQ